jgi:hypothetical protein
MATITENYRKDKINYKVQIRKKGIDVTKTFSNKDDADLYIFYKERLIENMENFNVPINEQVTLTQIVELQISNVDLFKKRQINDVKRSLNRINEILGKDRLLSTISLEEWVECVKILYSMDVYKGAKTSNGKRKMSLSTLKKIFSHISSAISYAKKQGIIIENLPLKVIQSYIRPLEEKENK